MGTKEWVLAFLEKDYEELVRLGFSPAATELDSLLIHESEVFTKRLDKNLGERFCVTLRTDNSREDTNLWTIGVKKGRGGIIRTVGFGGIKIHKEIFVFFIPGAKIRCNLVTSNDWIAENAVAISLKKLRGMKITEVCKKIQETLKNLWEKLLTVKVNQEEN